jgi:hypothetical protein
LLNPHLEQAHAHLASAVASLTMGIEQASEFIDVMSVLELAKMLTEAQRRLLSLSAAAKSIAPAPTATTTAKAAPPPAWAH